MEVRGTIVNAFTDDTSKLKGWKRTVASTVKNVRGGASWNPDDTYAITLEFRFHPGNHGNQPLVMKNFVEPVIAGLAAGLFCSKHIDPRDIERFGFDNSNIVTLLIHCGRDAPNKDQEGVRVFVSSAWHWRVRSKSS